MILVSGGTGLLGGHLLYALLQKGKKVRALYRSKKRLDVARQILGYYPNGASLFDCIEWVPCDLLDLPQLEAAMQGVSEVYHCAAMVSFRQSDRDELIKINVEGTANIANLSLALGVSKFCHVSSIASFGRPLRDKMVDERCEWDPEATHSDYALSKYLGEKEVWRNMEEGLNAVIVNPSTIIGSGNWASGSSALFGKVWSGLSFYTDGENGFVDVRDVVDCMIRLMEKERFGEQYIVVGHNRPFRDILNHMAHALKKRPPKYRAGQWLSQLALGLETLRCALTGAAPVLTKNSVRIAQDKQRYSNKKVEETIQMNFRPIELSIEEAASDFLKEQH